MHRFRIVIEQTSTGYSAYSPELLGCIAVGNSHAETEVKMREAIGFHLDALREDGHPVPSEYEIIRIDDPRADPPGINNLEYDDPIVAEVYAIREQLFAEAGYDLDELFRQSRDRQAKSGRRVVDLSRKPADGDASGK